MALVIGEVKPGFLADNKGSGTLIPLPPQNGGTIGWGQVYLSFGSDFGDVTLRVAIFNATSSAWRIEQIKVQAAGPRIGVQIQDGDQKVSVGRVQNGSSDTGVWPCGWMIESILKA